MDWLVFILAFIIGSAGVALYLFGIDNFISWLAKHDVWWSPFRLKPPGGQYFTITKGKEPSGDFAGIVESVRDWAYDTPGKPHVFVPDPSGALKYRSTFDIWLNRLNVAWVGFFVRFYTREREYDIYEKTPGGTKKEVINKEIRGDASRIFYFQQHMAVAIQNAETAGVPKVNLVLTFMMRILDPNKAEFQTGKPEENATNAVIARGKGFVSTKAYRDLLRESSTDSINDLIEFVLKANEGGENPGDVLTPDQGGLRSRYGIEIYSVFLESVELSAEDEYAKAVQGKAIEEEHLARARVAADRKEVDSKAEADAIDRVLRARNSVPNGHLFALAEAIKEHNGTLSIGGNSTLGILDDNRKIITPP